MNRNAEAVAKVLFDAVTGGDEVGEPELGEAAAQFIGREVGQQHAGGFVHAVTQERFIKMVSVQMRHI